MEKAGNMTMHLQIYKDNAPITSSDGIINIEGGYYAVIRYSGRHRIEFIKHKNFRSRIVKDNI